MKEVTALIKLQIPAGKANPSPPVGPALGQHGLNIAQFCKEFNDRSQEHAAGTLLPVIISVYKDRSYSFEVKQPPMSTLILAKANLKSGSASPNRDKVGHLTLDQVKDIATQKMPDLNAATLEAAMKTVMGTARSMGITVDSMNEGVDA